MFSGGTVFRWEPEWARVEDDSVWQDMMGDNRHKQIKGGQSKDDQSKDGDGIDSDRVKETCLLYTSPSPRDLSTSRMPSSA